MSTAKKIYGYRNCAYHCGPRPDGYAMWFSTAEARDSALAQLRDQAIADGLSSSAAQAGIYAVSRPAADLDPDDADEMAAFGYVRGE